MRLRAFVAMPCDDQHEVDFAAIRSGLIGPALEQAGFDVSYADDLLDDFPAERNGLLASSAIAQRLLPDLVIVDLHSADARARYECGVQHALLAQAILIIHDEYKLRTVEEFATDGALTFGYHLEDGKPDPARLPADRDALARLARQAAHGSEATTTLHHQHAHRDRKLALSIFSTCFSGSPGGTPVREVFLFSGHMIDAPGRAEPRFPAIMEPAAATAILARLDECGIGRHDLAICGGACGGDLLFAEAALRRGCPLQLHLQFREAEFLQASVAFAGRHWVDRYLAVRDHPLTRIRVQPDELGPPARGLNPYVRNNLWQLYTASACGAERLHFVALWDGQDSANPGGTQNMVEVVRRHGGQVSILDTRRLFGQAPPVRSVSVA